MSGREVKYTGQVFQSGKAYCAAFCAFPVALIAGSGFTASCKGLQWSCNGWKQRRTAITYSKMSFGWFIYTWASMKCFRHFTIKRTSSPPPPPPRLLRGSLAYIFNEFLRYKLCKEWLRIKSFLAPKFLVSSAADFVMTTKFLAYRGKIKDQKTGNRLEVNFVQNKLILHENNTAAFH